MPAPFTEEEYKDLITSYLRGMPNYTATVGATVAPLADLQAFFDTLPQAFDLDTAVGVQLDAVGEWVGRSRYVNIPIANVWFSFDTDGLGWDQGVWKGPFDPDVGIYALDDETYRLLLRCKIAANQWDGTVPSAKAALDAFFNTAGTLTFIEDRQDMSMVFGIAGTLPNAVMLALFANGYVPLKPMGVRAIYKTTSVDGTALFGFDVNNDLVQGWDQGSWGVDPGEQTSIGTVTFGDFAIYFGDDIVTFS